MYIIIVGVGGIGRNLTEVAVGHGDNVVIIDQNEGRCNEILEQYDVLAIVGNSTNKQILEDAGVERADVLITTTSDDSVNLMTCWLAKRYHVPNVISIVNQKEHSDPFNEVGVKISENPDELVATRLYYWATNPHLQQLASIKGGKIFETTVEEGAPMVDREVREVAAGVPGVAGLDKCFVRKMGFDYYVDLHVVVDGGISVRDGHRIAHGVKDALRHSNPKITDVLIHIEPLGEEP